MPPSIDYRHIQTSLRKFRMATVKSILRNSTNALAETRDVELAPHIAELYDAYAVSILLDWLATKYGFPAYSKAISMENQSANGVLETWPCLSGQYPFVVCSAAKFPAELRFEAMQILESSLSARLDLLGSFHELISEEELNFDQYGQPYIKKNDKRCLSGQFFTPPWVVSYGLDSALSKHSKQFVNEIKTAASFHRQSSKSFFRMFDPACGTGNFLLGAFHWFSRQGLTANERFWFVQNSLYGTDVDGRCVSLTRLGLVLCLADYFAALSAPKSRQTLDLSLSDLVDSLTKHISVQDSVMLASNQTSFSGQFDLVATNPPYISFGSRNQVRPPESWSRYLRACYPESTEYKIRLHSVFQEVALRCARPRGKALLLVPDAFLTGRFYEKLRRQLLQSVRIESLTELPDSLFPGATVGRWCLAVYSKAATGFDRSYQVDLCAFPGDICAAEDRQLVPDLQFQLPLSLLVAPDRQRFRLMFNDLDRDIWTSVDSLPMLKTVLRGHTGLRGRHGQGSIVAAEPRGDNWHRGIKTGASVRRHLVNWEGSWLKIDPQVLFSGGFDSKVISNPKLLVRQTGDAIVAALDSSGLYHLNNVHSFSPQRVKGKELSDIAYFDGLMNSTFWLYLYRLKSREEGRPLAQVDIEMVESMPVPEDNPKLSCLISQLVETLIGLNRRHVADNDQPDLHDSYAVGAQDWQISKPGQSIQRRDWKMALSFIDRALDRLVYQSYSLSEHQIQYIEGKCLKQTASPLPDLDEVAEFLKSEFYRSAQAS